MPQTAALAPSATRARTASALTARPTQTAPRERSVATDSVQARAMVTPLRQRQQLQNKHPLNRHVRRSVAQTMSVRYVGLLALSIIAKSIPTHLGSPLSYFLIASISIALCLGTIAWNRSMNFWKTSERGGRSFPIQKISLRFFRLFF